MATQAQVIDRILRLLRAVGTGQSAASEDSTVVSDYLPFKIDELAQRNVIYIADADSVPDNALYWFSVAVAQDLAEDFGRQKDPAMTAQAEAMLRMLNPRDGYPVLEAVYF